MGPKKHKGEKFVELNLKDIDKIAVILFLLKFIVNGDGC